MAAAWTSPTSSSSPVPWDRCSGLRTRLHSSVHVKVGMQAERRESIQASSAGFDDALNKWTPTIRKPSSESQPSSLRAAPTKTIPVPAEVETFTSKPSRTERPPSKQLHTIPTEGERMWEWIETIRGMFRSMGDGEISISAYDTAWVARVPSLDGRQVPQFPKSLQWIMENQLADGSWGEEDLFLAYDRICSTLSCVVALKTWKMGDKIVEKGVEFIRRTMAKMETEDSNHMPIGFEIVFPAMMEEAKELGLKVPHDAPVLKKINIEREKKLQRIPMDVLHKYPTTLLHSLEGLHKIVDWEKIMKLQSPNGGFACSPASTACALMYTGNKKCLQYLNNILEKFNGAVPNVYPVDLFEHLWMVDRVERLGISRYFEREIKDALEYVYRYWTDKGIGWARESPVQDVDDTAMAFRLLRTHKYHVSPDVFKNFQKGEAFFCFPGQAGQAVTGMFNLYRASQVMFPGEEILEQARSFSQRFLEEKREKNELHDKWIIMKDLPGEVEFALKYPFHASLQRIETRKYIEQYAADDVWIGKSLYKMPFVNNHVFLALAKADFNMCQSLHTKELQHLERWYAESSLSAFKFSHEKIVQAYFSAAATMFEPELAPARLVWSQCWFLSAVIKEYFDTQGSIDELEDFVIAVKRWDPSLVGTTSSAKARILFRGLHNAVDNHSKQGLIYQGRDVTVELKEIWHKWLSCYFQKATWRATGYHPRMEEYIEASSSELEPAVRSTMYFVGERLDAEVTRNPRLLKMMNVATSLAQDIQNHKNGSHQQQISCCSSTLDIVNGVVAKEAAVSEIQKLADEQMQQLLHETLHSTTLPPACKQLFLDAAKVMNLLPSINVQNSFTALGRISEHVQRVLFQPVVYHQHSK